MPDRFQNFIDGRWTDSAAKASAEDLNPANRGDVLGVFPRSDHRDVDRAVEAAAAHGRDWAQREGTERSACLQRAAALLQSRGEEAAALVTRESGKLVADSRTEVSAAIEILTELAGAVLADRGRSGWGTVSARVHAPAPVGVVGVVTPWSLPLALPAALVGAALAAGNAVVLKPSEETPLLATRLVEIFLDAGLPSGVLGLVQGSGEEAGAPLVRHPEVGLVVFAGFPDVAREVAIACAAEQKPLLPLVEGREALIVLEDAEVEAAVATALGGAFGPLGRRRSVQHAILQGKAGREVQGRLVEAAQRLRPGDGLLPETGVPPLINERQVKRLHTYVRLGAKEGAKLLCGGEIQRDGECRKGFFYAPTVLGEIHPKMRVAQDPVSGPILALLPAADREQALKWANRLPTGRAVTVCSRDLPNALRAAAALRADVVRINGAPGSGLRVSEWLLGPSAGVGSLVDRLSRWRTLVVDVASKREGPDAATA
jgi:aldehyde dehydrogenase (NAD+)